MSKQITDVKALEVNIELLKNFKLSQMVSWSQIQLMCAIYGYEASYELFKLLMIGASVSGPAAKLFLDVLNDPNLDPKFAMDSFEYLYMLFSPERTYLKANPKTNLYSFSVLRFWHEKVNDIGDEDPSMASGSSGQLVLFTDILKIYMKRWPVALVKFYDKWKLFLHSYDQKTIGSIFAIVKHLATKSPQWKRVLDAMQKEKMNTQKLAMYMN